MRAVIQRVLSSRVTVDGQCIGEIGPGLLVLLGIHTSDTNEQAKWMAEKIVGLRIFEDLEGKMNLSILEKGFALFAVSQFTLYGDCQKGRRPSFIQAARPEIAEPIYQKFIQGVRMHGIPVAEGRFGADMKVELINDGPVTLVVDSPGELK